MINQFFLRKKCKDPKSRHKSIIYKSSKNPLKKLGELATLVQPFYQEVNLSTEDEVCNDCYSLLKKEVSSSDDSKVKNSSDSNENKQQTDENLEAGTSAGAILHSIEAAEAKNDETGADLFSSQETTCSQPLLSSEELFEESQSKLDEINQIITTLGLNVSPLKSSKSLPTHYHQTYSNKKRKQATNSFDVQVAAKIPKYYKTDITVEDEKSRIEIEWLNNIKIALGNFSSISEKIQLLTIVPTSISKSRLLEHLDPEISHYMISEARSLVNSGNIYKKLESSSGHALKTEVLSRVSDYY